jgi:hypothetical protein
LDQKTGCIPIGWSSLLYSNHSLSFLAWISYVHGNITWSSSKMTLPFARHHK